LKSNQQIDPLAWEVFSYWQALPKKEMSLPDWQVFDELLPLHNKLLEEQYNLFLPLLERWNVIFSALGKDPTYLNWDHFRPLRLTREEDWADWLAHLIQTSETGNFSRYLLQIDNITSYSKPVRVLREDMCRQYRADLIIEWQKQKFTHIEVKIGDMHLVKTFPASEVFQEKYQVKNENWTNYILLLSEQVPEWENIATNITSDIQIKAITWEEVCIALRKALIKDEHLTWKVWAWSYLGAIEQLIIGYKGYQLPSHKPGENLYKKINILEKALS